MCWVGCLCGSAKSHLQVACELTPTAASGMRIDTNGLGCPLMSRGQDQHFAMMLPSQKCS